MKRALIVDDSRAIRMVARRIMEPLGFEVSEAENADHAFGAWDHAPPDLMFANWYMRGTPWLFGLIRGNPRWHRTKLVVFLVENDPLEIDRAVRAGAHTFLLKPFNRETLEARLDEMGFAARKENASQSASERRSVEGADARENFSQPAAVA